jgi:hypothetical protein
LEKCDPELDYSSSYKGRIVKSIFGVSGLKDIVQNDVESHDENNAGDTTVMLTAWDEFKRQHGRYTSLHAPINTKL